MRVLVFSASFGAGHVRAAEALIEALRKKVPACEIIHLDFLAFLSESFNKFVRGTYIELIKHTPRLWGKFYYRTAKIPPRSLPQRLLNSVGRREFLRYIQAKQPDLIICTYPTVAGVLAELRLKGMLNIPVVTVITDYAVHNHWVHPGVDLYIAGCENVLRSLVAQGIDANRVAVTGIPVSPRFENKVDRAEVAARFNLNPDYPTCLLMGGAFGVLSGIKRVCELIITRQLPLQTIVVCGKDKRLYQSLDDVVAGKGNSIVRLGFVTNVEELMGASDILVTKAGGLTVTEALTKRLPLIIYKPIPGQEEENAEFVTAIGAGWIAVNEEQLAEILQQVLREPEVLVRMRQAAEKALPGHAAERAVEIMLKLLENPQILSEKLTGIAN